MASRNERKKIAQETVNIIEKGKYTAPSGKQVELHKTLDRARRLSQLYDPEKLENMTIRHVFKEPYSPSTPTIDVVNKPTLAAARRLTRQNVDEDILALNFASARQPGGGFLSGASAQEESLCRKSGLYACLREETDYYERNEAYGSSLYTDHMIYSPDVPVFRDADDQLLESPYQCSFITAPAVNAGAVRKHEPKRVNMIQPVMEQRIEKLIALCVHLSHSRLVLGAWGCGVFQNDPGDVARWFGRYLGSDSPYAHYINRVIFAVLDGTPDERIITPFRKQFE